VLKIQSLASGSKGNVVFIASDTTRILVDVGLTMPNLLRRLQSANIDPEKIDAVLVTHEHADHIIGLESFIRRFKPKLYVHNETADIFSFVPNEHIETFNGGFQIGDITVNYFNVPHDSRFCFGYSFLCGGAKISLATDLGRIGDEIIAQMSGSQIVMLECNHDLLRLTGNKKYPLILKRRITSPHGHLSNPASALAIYKLAQMGVGQIILAHLSEQNNSPTLAFETVRNFLANKGVIEGRDIWIDVATQDKVGLPFSAE
jgi:phosphoribosyl 1,2-cyclic phosphodiesterase